MTDAGIPTEELPRGWVSTDTGFKFEHPTAGIAVCADRRPDDAVAELVGEPCAWRVWYERRVGETTECLTVGTVATRDAAVDGLLACMRRVSDGSAPTPNGGVAAADTPNDSRWTALSTLTADVVLHDTLPTASNGGAPVDEASYARSWAQKLTTEG